MIPIEQAVDMISIEQGVDMVPIEQAVDMVPIEQGVYPIWSNTTYVYVLRDQANLTAMMPHSKRVTSKTLKHSAHTQLNSLHMLVEDKFH